MNESLTSARGRFQIVRGIFKGYSREYSIGGELGFVLKIKMLNDNKGE
jgi:hypothetical protein